MYDDEIALPVFRRHPSRGEPPYETLPTEPWTVECARCGRTIPGERSRLMWSPDGTFRLCGGAYERKCLRLAAQKETT